MECIAELVKIIMFVFNLACLLVGLVLLVLGTIFYVSVDAYRNTFIGNIVAVPIVLIVIGVIIFLVSFLGCCGTIKSSKCMLILYVVILIIIFIVQLAIGIYGLVLINDNKEELKKNLIMELTKMLNNCINGDNTAKEIMDALQERLNCCGVDNSWDYDNCPILPGACCGKTENDRCALIETYSKGCADAFFERIEFFVKSVSIVAIVLCSVELLGVLFSIFILVEK